MLQKVAPGKKGEPTILNKSEWSGENICPQYKTKREREEG
jgi:hypothetical protein